MQLLRLNVDQGGEPLPVPGGTAALQPTYSARTRRLAFTINRPNSDLWFVPLASPGTSAGGEYEFAPSSRQEAAPVFSPDGRMVAHTSARAGYPNVWVCEVGSARSCRQVTHFESSMAGPSSWSPDSRRLVLGSNHAGNFDLYMVDVDDGSKPRLFLGGPADESFPFWSRDGRWIYFASNRSGRFEVWRAAAEGGGPAQVTKDGGYLATESFDAKWLYYTRNNNSVTSL